MGPLIYRTMRRLDHALFYLGASLRFLIWKPASAAMDQFVTFDALRCIDIRQLLSRIRIALSFCI